jgi:ABC-type Fe3+ transport system permease subunit
MFSLIDTILHHNDETPAAKRWGDRALSAWGFVMYSLFCVYCISIASSSNSSSESSASDRSQKTQMSAEVLRWPGGAFWLGLLAAILITMAVFLVSRAWRRSFQPRLERDRMSPRMWRLATVLGTVGYLGRAGLFAVVGGCIFAAAIEDRPRYGQGVNGALRVLANSTAGPALLGLLAAALVIYGLYMFIETRYRRV